MPDVPQVLALKQALQSVQEIVTTGLVLQELLQGFSGPKQAEALVERFRSLPLITPDRQDHIAAAQLRNACRKRGVQVGTIDALFAQICLRHRLILLTTDADFQTVLRSVAVVAILPHHRWLLDELAALRAKRKSFG